MARLRASGRKAVTVPAFCANAGVEAWYRQCLRQVIRKMNASMLYHTRAAYKCAEPTIGFAHDAPNSSLLLRRALSKWGTLWTNKLDRMSQEIATSFANRNTKATNISMASAFKRAGFTVKFRPTPKSLAAYQAVVAEQVNLIKSIPQQYLKDVQTSVWQSVMKGGDLAQLSKGIQEKYGIAYRRAAFIARDQNNKAKAVLENVNRQELGLQEAFWDHSGGGRHPRPQHVAFSGKRYMLAKGAFLEGKWVWPGSEPNCRCSSRAIVPGYND